MTNYINADLRHVLHKQSFLGVVSAFAVLFTVLVFIYFNLSFTAEMYMVKSDKFPELFPADDRRRWVSATSSIQNAANDPNTSHLIALAKLYKISPEDLPRSIENVPEKSQQVTI